MRQEDTSKPRNARWRVFGRLSTLRTVASIMMIALFLSGCATSRKASVATEESVKQVSADTLQSEVRQTWTETVPQEEAKLEIPLAELTNLPEKAEYRAKNGRASATVQNKGGIIVVYATCDSLQRQWHISFEVTSRPSGVAVQCRTKYFILAITLQLYIRWSLRHLRLPS
jgi:uncharacterized protein YceK